MHRVLIIEDDHAQCEALSRLLYRRGLQPTCAETLEEGLACMRAQKFHCVVLDLGLPDSPALETARRIPEFHPIPVVAVTGSDDRDLVRECRQNGAGYALKGSDSLGVMEKVLLAVERYEPTKEVEDQIIATQRERARAAERSREHESKPWVLTWAPAISVVVALLVASCTGGMFLYRSVSNEAVQAERSQHRFSALETSMAEFRRNMEHMNRTQIELALKDQASIDERQGLRRDLTAVVQQQAELRTEVLRRLERIEDAQTALLKEMTKRP